MWQDIGLGDWLFDMDREDDVDRIVPDVLSFITNPTAAHHKAKAAADKGVSLQRMMTSELGRNLETA